MAAEPAGPASLLEAIDKRCLPDVKQAVENGDDPCCSLNDDNYPTVIHKAVYNKDIDIVLHLLCHSKTQLLKNVLIKPFSAFDSPLHYALAKLDVKLVSLLLDYGADPNLIVMSRTGLTPLCSLPLREQKNDDLSSVYYEIVSLLLKKGAIPEIRSKTNEVALHFICHFAICSPSTAFLLIDSSPPISYDNFGRFVASPFSQNPLAASFRSVFGLVSGFLINGASIPNSIVLRIHRTFKHAIVPLITCGALTKPDLLTNNYDVVRIAVAQTFINNLLWKSPYNVLRLLASSRQPCHVNLHLFSSPVIQFQNQFNQLRLDIQKAFPLSLQDYCRITILRLLPPGPRIRSQAISDLSLPSTLISFLKFNDFEF